jgi:hypothetical protein
MSQAPENPHFSGIFKLSRVRVSANTIAKKLKPLCAAVSRPVAAPAFQAMDTQLNALPALLSSLGAFCLFELHVFQTFLDNLRTICSGLG